MPVRAEPEAAHAPLTEVNGATMHAIDRFRERTGSKHSDEEVCRKLLEMLATAKEVKLKPPYNVIALLNHNFQDARYFRSGGFILVVEGDCISTVHHGQAGRWK
jgi:hypothetical protein